MDKESIADLIRENISRYTQTQTEIRKSFLYLAKMAQIDAIVDGEDAPVYNSALDFLESYLAQNQNLLTRQLGVILIGVRVARGDHPYEGDDGALQQAMERDIGDTELTAAEYGERQELNFYQLIGGMKLDETSRLEAALDIPAFYFKIMDTLIKKYETK